MRFQVNPAEDAGQVFDAGNALMGGMMQQQSMNALAQGGMVVPTAFGPMVIPAGGSAPYAPPVPGQAGTMYIDNPAQYNALRDAGGPTQAAAAASGPINKPEVAAGIVETANALGIDPLDLATVISYETAGTFDPTKRGPTTQWGQHRGLIQFGEPQARQHGVDWSDPVGSQLGADGAVASYLRSSGLQPGMGILDLYSTINAGAPGLYNRSDANNGGAPGTVRDKVENQMSGHRAKAAALLASLGL